MQRSYDRDRSPLLPDESGGLRPPELHAQLLLDLVVVLDATDELIVDRVTNRLYASKLMGNRLDSGASSIDSDTPPMPSWSVETLAERLGELIESSALEHMTIYNRLAR